MGMKVHWCAALAPVAVLTFTVSVVGQEGGPVVPEGFAPAVAEVCGLGQVDWTRGMAIATAHAMVKGPPTRQNKLKAARDARDKAYAKAVRLMAEVRVSAENTIQQLQKRNPDVCMKGFVQRFPVAHYKQWNVCTQEQHCEATMHVPFYGMKGLSIYIHDHVARKKLSKQVRQHAWQRQDAGLSACELPPDIVVDTTGLGLEQAVYPRVLDPCGNVLLSVENRDQNVVAHEGLVTYVTRTTPAVVPCLPLPATGWLEPSSPARRWGALAALMSGDVEGRPTSVVSGVVPGAPQGLLLAAARRRIRRRRVTVKASSKAKVDIVLSASAAKKLTSDPKTAAALKKGRVYVVVDSRKAAIQGRGPTLDEDRLWAAVRRTTR